MVDFLDKEVRIGDEVIITEPSYHNLVRGVIVKFTPKGIKVRFKPFARTYEKETFVYNGEFVLIENK